MNQNSPRLKSVRRIVLLGDSTPAKPIMEATEPKKKKRQSWIMRPLEKLTRTWVEAQHAAAEEYLVRHAQSARKEKDGWVLDLGRNTRRAWRAGVKRLSLPL